MPTTIADAKHRFAKHFGVDLKTSSHGARLNSWPVVQLGRLRLDLPSGMLLILPVLVVVCLVFVASLVIERLLGRSRREFEKPGWYWVAASVFLPLGALVYLYVSLDSPYIYGLYGAAGGVASLVAQCIYGRKIEPGVSQG
ncbi:hypothetical protein ACSFA7_19240 [Variovorax sp. LT1R20]|uniref:hypothetical protein n=1 Tax=Variovorax sp. LT1R20 TaxID=3443729 RepID=UPI003F468052